MKGIVRLLSLILVVCAAYFGYTGYKNMNKGDDNVFIVDKKVTITVYETDTNITFSFLNTSGKAYNLKVHFGIKGDKNYTAEVDEVVITINNLVAYDDEMDITFLKSNFKKGVSYSNQTVGHATINVGNNVEVIEEYNYVHKLDVGIDGKTEKFHHGESVNYVYFGAAGVSALMAVLLFVKSNGMPDPVKPEKPSKKKKETESLWDNEPTDNFDDVSYSQTSNETVKMTDEEKAKYLEGMKVIDMKKDELD